MLLECYRFVHCFLKKKPIYSNHINFQTPLHHTNEKSHSTYQAYLSLIYSFFLFLQALHLLRVLDVHFQFLESDKKKIQHHFHYMYLLMQFLFLYIMNRIFDNIFQLVLIILCHLNIHLINEYV